MARSAFRILSMVSGGLPTLTLTGFTVKTGDAFKNQPSIGQIPCPASMLRIALALFLLTGVAAYGQISLPAAGVINTIAGGGSTNPGDGGLATSAQLTNPTAVAVDSSGNIYFSDTNANRVRKITAATGIITTVAGNGTAGYSGDNGQATSAMLNSPGGVAVDHQGPPTPGHRRLGGPRRRR